MRLTFLATLCMIALYSGLPGAALAQDYPWCVAAEEGRTDCSFSTYEQCQATASGIGSCYQNPRAALRSVGPTDHHRRAVLGERFIERSGSAPTPSFVRRASRPSLSYLSLLYPAASVSFKEASTCPNYLSLSVKCGRNSEGGGTSRGHFAKSVVFFSCPSRHRFP